MLKEQSFIDLKSYSLVLLASIIILLLNIVLDDNSGLLPIFLTLLVVGMFFVYIMNLQSREDFPHALYLFFLFFAIYFLYATIIHWGLLNVYNVTNIKSDELFFYGASQEAYLRFGEGYGFFDIADIQRFGDTSGAVYLMGRIAQLAHITGDNSVLGQKIGIVFIASLIPTFVYMIGRLYFSIQSSFNSAIIYGLLSFTFYLSSALLRDLHIALTFIITFYIILKPFSWVNFLVLIVVLFWSYFLRDQTGIFLMGSTMIYLFVAIEKSIVYKNIRISIYLLLLLSIIAFILSSEHLRDMFMTISSSSSERSASSANSGSLGAKIAKLPFGLNAVALLGFSQLQPFPISWIFQGHNKGFFQLTYLLAGIAWFFGWGFLLVGIFNKKILKKIELKPFLIFIFSIIYLLLIAIIDFSVRRQMSVYPILYIFMVYSYLLMSPSHRTKTFISMGAIYIFLTLTINFMKV